MNKKAVIYARVSTEMQEREGFSIPAQLDFLREFAKKHNIEIVKEYSEAQSAKAKGREKFNEMINFLNKSKDVKSILVEKTDRLYRNLTDYVKIGEDDFDIYLVKENTVISKNASSHDKFIHGIKVLIAKNFIDNLREETQKGRKRKIEEGYFIGQVPYGYKKLDKNITVPDEDKSKFVQRAFELYAKGDLSLKALRDRLYQEGYIYQKSSSKITTGMLEKMLKNECYTGMLKYDKKLSLGKHKPLVSNTLFYKAQQAFKKDNKPKTRQGHNFLFSGQITCGNCGRAITSEIKKGKHIYYHCTGNYGKCQQRKTFIKEDALEAQFNNAIKEITLDDKLADYLNAILDETYKKMNLTTKERFDSIKRQVSTLKTNKNKLLDLYIDNCLDKETYKEKSFGYDCEIERLENILNQYKNKDKDIINKGTNIIELAKGFYSLYLKQDVEEKQKMLKTLFYNASLKDGKLSYTFNRPFNYLAEYAQNKKKYPGCDSNA